MIQGENTMPPKRWKKVFTLCGIILLPILFVLLAMPGFTKARMHSAGLPCPENLQKIDGTKEQWALENNKKAGDTPTWDDLVTTTTSNYLRKTPHCPTGGVYTIGPIGTDPTCSLAQPQTPAKRFYRAVFGKSVDPAHHRLP